MITSKKQFCGGIILGSIRKSKVITRTIKCVRSTDDEDADGGASEKVKGMGLCRASERVVLCCVSRLVMCARGKHKQSDVASSERNRRAFSKGLLIARRTDADEEKPPDNRSMSIIRRDKQSAIDDGKGIVEEDLLDARGAGSAQK